MRKGRFEGWIGENSSCGRLARQAATLAGGSAAGGRGADQPVAVDHNADVVLLGALFGEVRAWCWRRSARAASGVLGPRTFRRLRQRPLGIAGARQGRRSAGTAPHRRARSCVPRGLPWRSGGGGVGAWVVAVGVMKRARKRVGGGAAAQDLAGPAGALVERLDHPRAPAGRAQGVPGAGRRGVGVGGGSGCGVGCGVFVGRGVVPVGWARAGEASAVAGGGVMVVGASALVEAWEACPGGAPRCRWTRWFRGLGYRPRP